MKYRLKKDLPFAKAGNDIQIIEMADDSKCLQINYDACFNTSGNLNYYRFPLTDAVALREDGWIEEIKPREWWVNLYGVGEGGIFKTKEAADTVASSGRKEVIKVREIINEQ